jgi:predicted metal-dependent peptidase
MDGTEVPRRMSMIGRGGTDFRPVFEWIQGNALDASPILLYATDGYGVFPEHPPGWPTIWLLTREGLAAERVPFGTCARLP